MGYKLNKDASCHPRKASQIVYTLAKSIGINETKTLELFVASLLLSYCSNGRMYLMDRDTTSRQRGTQTALHVVN